ncbi:LapA family protein [Amycolatopsis jejuensis]|uniref:LapA family protein n=1 Tax=Amycolatopsis jejuensis TaxID=330084 RepID=UPI00055420E0|nr:LapA family protein [Amycolatopsis jejuensis]
MSIFGQVWLWSLLAFFVGALVAWLVLARPARKRVRDLEAELTAAHAESARVPANASRTAVLTPPAEDWTRDQREHAPTELIPPATRTFEPPTRTFEPESEYDAEYRTAPEPETTRDEDVDEAFARAEAEETADSTAAYRVSATDYLTPVERESGYHRIADDHDSGQHRVAEPAPVEEEPGYHRVAEPAAEPAGYGTAEPGGPGSAFHRAAEPADQADHGYRGVAPASGYGSGVAEPANQSDSGYGRVAEPADGPDSGYHSRVAEPVEEHDSGYHRLAESTGQRSGAEPDALSGLERRLDPAAADQTSASALSTPEPFTTESYPAEPFTPESSTSDGSALFTPSPTNPSTSDTSVEPSTSESEASEGPVSLFRPGPRNPPAAEPDWFAQPDPPARSAFEEPSDPTAAGMPSVGYADSGAGHLASEPGAGHLDEAPATDHLTSAELPEAPAESPESPEPIEPPESIEDIPDGAQVLPKRQRRESPRGGFDPPRPIQPSMRPVERRDPGVSGAHSGSLFEPSVQPNQAAMNAPEPPPARQSADDAIPPGPFGPGSAMPRPGGGRPGDGFTVKASVTALRYCTEESAQFPRMVAEVWFRSAADAERVGFRPLH